MPGEDPIDVTVDLPPRLGDRLDALATVYDSDQGDIMRQALREHLDAMLDRRQTLKAIADAYIAGDLSDDEVTMLLGVRSPHDPSTELALILGEEIKRMQNDMDADDED